MVVIYTKTHMISYVSLRICIRYKSTAPLSGSLDLLESFLTRKFDRELFAGAGAVNALLKVASFPPPSRRIKYSSLILSAFCYL